MIQKRIVASAVLAFLAGWLFTMSNINGAFADQTKSKSRAISVRMGTLTLVDSQFVIKSGRTTYPIAGRDFSPWVGKKVKVTGSMVHSGKGRVLEVTKIEEVKRNR